MPYERNGKLRQDTDKTNRLRIGRTNGNVETKLQNKDWRFKNIEGPNQKTWKENLESSSDFLSLFISDKGVRSGQDTKDTNTKENNRPLTVLSCVNNVFERLPGNQVATKYDNRHGDCLTAYRKHNSCETTLILLVEDWKLARGNRLLLKISSTDM